MEWDQVYKKLSSLNLIIILIIGSILSIVAKPEFVLSFFIGAIISLLNFHLMQRKIRSLFINKRFIGNQMNIVFNFYFRLAIIGIIFYILIDKGLDPIGFLIGVGMLSMGILIMGIMYGIKYYKGS